jgi:hypothetical protein
MAQSRRGDGWARRTLRLKFGANLPRRLILTYSCACYRRVL